MAMSSSINRFRGQFVGLVFFLGASIFMITQNEKSLLRDAEMQNMHALIVAHMVSSKSNDEKEPKSPRNHVLFRNSQRDLFCHGCRHVSADRTDPCGFPLVRGVLRPRGLTTLDTTIIQGESAHNISEITVDDLPQRCQHCLGCPEQNHWYGRMDEAAPPVVEGVSHYLSSIPEIHRFPRNVSSWSTYFRDPANKFPQRIYLAEYNPSIVRIPIDLIPSSLRDERIVYLASFRVSTVQRCVGFPAMHNYPSKNKTTWQNHLGLAFLREDLGLVADAVFDLKAHRARIQDSRLFLLHNQLYWSAGSTLHALWLVNATRSRSVVTVAPRFTHANSPWQDPIYFQTQDICATSFPGAKNLQFFVDDTSTVIAEYFPMADKIALDTSRSCSESVLGKRPVNKTRPARSFGTVDELHFWRRGIFQKNVLTAERGSYCCAPLTLPGGNRSLLLGISHSKFAFKSRETRDSLPGNVSANHYFSTFYAMERSPPYSVVALSGKFCLGFPTEDEWAQGNPHSHRLKNDRLRLASDFFDCPAIHFVSGLTDTPDGDHYIISYGVNDCAPRMIKVRQSDVLRLLFPNGDFP